MQITRKTKEGFSFKQLSEEVKQKIVGEGIDLVGIAPAKRLESACKIVRFRLLPGRV